MHTTSETAAAPSSVARHNTLTHCALCQANNKDVHFSVDDGRVGASPQQCTPCYEVFAPCSQVDTWSAFAARYRSDESFAARVDAAKNRRCFPGAGYQDMTQQEVTSSEAFVVKLSRKGFLLTKADLKFDQQKFTPAQLKLKNQVSVTTPTGEQHSGFIIADARSSFLEVEVSTTTTVSSHDLVLPRATTTIEDMATLAMKKAMQRSDINVSGQGKHFLDLLHGKSITLQDLRSRAERAQKRKNNRQALPNRLDCNGSGDDMDGSSSSGTGTVGDDTDGSDSAGDEDDKDTRVSNVVEKPCEVRDSSCERSGNPKHAETEYGINLGSGSVPRRQSITPKHQLRADKLTIQHADGVVSFCTADRTPNPTQPAQPEADLDGDGCSGARSLRSSRGARGSLPPDYWVSKNNLYDAMVGPVDKRLQLQANNCVDREKAKKTGDMAAALRLEKHMKLFALAISLQEHIVEDQDEQDTNLAIAAMHRAREEIPPWTFWGIYKRRQKQVIASLHVEDREDNIAACVRMFKPFCEIDDQKFHVTSPMLGPLSLVIPPQAIVKQFQQAVVDLLVPRITHAEGDDQKKRLSNAVGATLRELDTLPETADPPELIVQSLVEVKRVLRALLLLLEPSIDVATDLGVMDDLEKLNDAADLGKASDFATQIATMVKSSKGLSASLNVITRKASAWRNHGPTIKQHLERLHAERNQQTVGAECELIEAALLAYEKYAVSLPDGAAARVEQALYASASKLCDNALAAKSTTCDDVQRIQVMLQMASRALPFEARLDEYTQTVGTKLRTFNDGDKLCKFFAAAEALLECELACNAMDAVEAAASGCLGIEFGAEQSKKLDAIIASLWDKTSADLFIETGEANARTDRILAIMDTLSVKQSKDNGKVMKLRLECSRSLVRLREAGSGVEDFASKWRVERKPDVAEAFRHALLRYARLLNTLKDDNSALRKAGAEIDGVKDVVDRVGAEIEASAKSLIADRVASAEKSMTALRRVAGGHPDLDPDKKWCDALDIKMPWNEFEDAAKRTLLKLNKDELKLMMARVEAAFDEVTDLTQQFKIKNAWPEASELLTTCRITKASYELMFAYIHTRDLVELRKKTKFEMEVLQQFGIKASAMHPMLEARMKSAMKLQR